MSLFDAAYLIAAVALSPWLLWDAVRRRRRGWRGRLGGAVSLAASQRRILVHAVSVGEVNAVRDLVEQLQAGGAEVVVSVTTDTGFARAGDAFGAGVQVVRYPLDFSPCVSRFLNSVKPAAVLLAELEVWPNFLRQCQRRDIPVALVNGRLSERSFLRYRRVPAILRGTFAALDRAAMQNETYSARIRELGVPAERISVTGNMKWDTAAIADQVAGAEELATVMGIDRSRGLIVAGSTGPGEEAMLHAACPPGVQLLCAPRKPERFNEAAAALPGCVRRSSCGDDASGRAASGDRFLLDTIGELRRAYSLADVVVIGRSFAPLYGSDMMEPVALGKAVVIGPNCADFQDSLEALAGADALAQTDANGLGATLTRLMENATMRHDMARRGREVIRAQQGATERNARLGLALLNGNSSA